MLCQKSSVWIFWVSPCTRFWATLWKTTTLPSPLIRARELSPFGSPLEVWYATLTRSIPVTAAVATDCSAISGKTVTATTAVILCDLVMAPPCARHESAATHANIAPIHREMPVLLGLPSAERPPLPHRRTAARDT